MLLKVRASLDVPAVAVVEHTSVLETATPEPLIPPELESRVYSPPDLYTLHNSLLI
jgi:hypothetical protein